MNRACAALFCALLACPAWAALPDEIQVYTDDVEAPGERGLELHVNATPHGRMTPDYRGEVPPGHGLRITPEFTWGIAPGWDWALYLPTVHSGDGANYFAGPKFRLKWMPLRPGEGAAGGFAGVNAEIAFVARRFEQARRTMEVRPIMGYRNDNWLVSFNPILDTNLASPGKGVVTFAPAFKAARGIGNGNAVGVEYYADFGRLSHFAPRSEQSHNLYFVLDTRTLNVGVGRGLNAASDRWTIKAIFSF